MGCRQSSLNNEGNPYLRPSHIDVNVARGKGILQSSSCKGHSNSVGCKAEGTELPSGGLAYSLDLLGCVETKRDQPTREGVTNLKEEDSAVKIAKQFNKRKRLESRRVLLVTAPQRLIIYDVMDLSILLEMNLSRLVQVEAKQKIVVLVEASAEGTNERKQGANALKSDEKRCGESVQQEVIGVEQVKVNTEGEEEEDDCAAHGDVAINAERMEVPEVKEDAQSCAAQSLPYLEFEVERRVCHVLRCDSERHARCFVQSTSRMFEQAFLEWQHTQQRPSQSASLLPLYDSLSKTHSLVITPSNGSAERLGLKDGLMPPSTIMSGEGSEADKLSAESKATKGNVCEGGDFLELDRVFLRRSQRLKKPERLLTTTVSMSDVASCSLDNDYIMGTPANLLSI